MVAVCFYFQVHQPYRMGNYRVFDIGHDSNYFDDEKNKQIMRKVADKCYIPATKLIIELARMHKGKFRCAFSITGTALEQFEKYYPEVLDLFKEAVSTGCVEILSETYHHSLSFLYSKEEFDEQVRLHKEMVEKHFGVTPSVFRNTELIFNNELAGHINKLGYKGILAEGADRILEWRSPNFAYSTVLARDFPVLLKNYRLSDDIAFRFSNSSWQGWPLTAPKFAKWVNQVNGSGEIINLFMDYETFGEHQWEDKGIFDFIRHLPGEIMKHPDNSFVTPSEAIDKLEPRGVLDIHDPVSWADIERDLSAWRGNNIQHAALHNLYQLEADVKLTKDEKLIEDWRKLTTSDHFYYMCTKYFNDGDVHKYFNPYDSPYDSFIAFMNALKDIRKRIARHNKEKLNMVSKSSPDSENSSTDKSIVFEEPDNLVKSNSIKKKEDNEINNVVAL